MRWFSRLLDATDRAQRRHPWSSLPISLVRKMSDDQGGNLAALVAYYGFLSLFPLLLSFASILGFVLAGDSGLRARVLEGVARSFPGFSGTIDSTISGNGIALGVGLVVALWAGLGVTRALEGAMNTIWYIPMSERPNLWRSRIRGVAMLAVLGIAFILSSVLAGLQGTHVFTPAVANILSVVGPLALNAGLYVTAFLILTNRRLTWRRILPGALSGAVGWTLLQDLGAYYTRHEIAHASHLYGPLSLVVGLLAWIYLGAQLTLYAAQLNVVLAEKLWPRSLRGVSTEADRRSLLLRTRVLPSPADLQG
ncbi:MAG: YihY/virulence factor BrkB family protein [Acidobacteriota bacterium]|nr:YihY/virulence factor BrkB family protein [Acidobacteriota bacterium]